LNEELPEEEWDRWAGVKSFLREIGETIVLTLIIYGLVSLGFRNFRVIGDSMTPNFHQGQYLVVNKLTYRLHPPQRGDVIVFRPPTNPEKDYIKRVIGLPGETVAIREGYVYVDGRRLEESYIAQVNRRASWGPSLVGEDEYFVLGDNRNNSSDSRSWGMLPRENIIGQAWLSYWPPQEWGLVPHYTFPTGILYVRLWIKEKRWLSRLSPLPSMMNRGFPWSSFHPRTWWRSSKNLPPKR